MENKPFYFDMQEIERKASLATEEAARKAVKLKGHQLSSFFSWLANRVYGNNKPVPPSNVLDYVSWVLSVDHARPNSEERWDGDISWDILEMAYKGNFQDADRALEDLESDPEPPTEEE